jgi:hypothetical protein
MSNEFNIKNGFISNDNSRVIGNLTASTFYGSGAGLTGVQAGDWTGGTVSGFATFQAGLSATTISATTYYGDGSQLNGVVATNWAGGNVPDPSTFAQITVTGNTFLSVVTATTISGVTTLRSGTISATTITATNYTNLPTDIRVTGGTYSASVSTIIFTNNTGGTFNVTGITATGGGSFTGGTVTGATIFTNGLTANTINISSLQSGTFASSLGVDNTGRIVSGQTTSNFTGGTVTGGTIFTGGITANTISATTYYNLPVSGLTQGSNINITEGPPGNFTISQGASSAINVTGGTYNPSTRTIGFSADPITSSFSVTGFTSDYTRLSDWDSVNLYHYSGSAPSGTLTSDPYWTIRRISFSGASPTTMTANGSWDNRLSLQYSTYP